MTTYSVYVRQSGLHAIGDVVVVRDGFSFAAAVLPVIWALWHRHLLAAAGYLAIALALSALFVTVPMTEALQGVTSLGVAALQGFTAADVRRWSLERTGFHLETWGAFETADRALKHVLSQDHDLCADIGAAAMRGVGR